MFTGLIQDLGQVRRWEQNLEGALLTVASKKMASDVALGDSVAINGVCQSVVKLQAASFTVQTVHTTLQKTTLGKLAVGAPVNLELAMRASDRLGGHLVTGHVNGVARIIKIRQIGNNYLPIFQLPAALMTYLVLEGPVAIDGISLTISDLRPSANEVEVSIIPLTWQQTNLAHKRPGDLVNVEVDILAKYVENFVGGSSSPNRRKISIDREWLHSKGY